MVIVAEPVMLLDKIEKRCRPTVQMIGNECAIGCDFRAISHGREQCEKLALNANMVGHLSTA